MKRFKHKVAMFFVLFALTGGVTVTSCSEADDVHPQLHEPPGTEGEDGSNDPNPPCPPPCD